MQEVDTGALLGATTNLARIHQIFSGLETAYNDALIPASVDLLRPQIEAFQKEAGNLGARLSIVATERLLKALDQEPCVLTVRQAITSINDVESRFADYLVEVRMFALNPDEGVFFNSADDLVQMAGFSSMFPTAAFEVEEAAKCLALGRFTASVFHSMRMLEVGIKAVAKRLGIPNPAKAAEKNWGIILKTIITKVDENWPKAKRLPGSDGSKFEDMYAHLDAVRNPWRNATMHVENTYAPHEALHILRCSAFFLRKLSEVSNEDGIEPDIAELLGDPANTED
ncbi:hypothetical protein [Altererythrobacter sp. ZODW24]|uniref:hypothetical protein n=1 Tax=Altererythrobacter sp. ZODW24 TaxID=2185142 RepID=UPI0013B3FC6D|nr:hypothetical protein [Altererythrobacter sp. ZODW24]